MAKMIPPYCDDGAPNSEKQVFGRLKEDPDTTEWTVLHSLGLARRRSGPYGEIDFVAIIPREGIVCLEVKGGGVSCRNGVWRTVDGRGHVHELRKSPFRQVQEAMFALRDSIRERFQPHSPESQCPIGCAVVFPDVLELPPTPEFEPSDVICGTRRTETGTLPDRHTANLRLRFELAAVLATAARRLPLDDLVDTVLRETEYHQAVAASGDPDAADRLDNLAELGFDAAVFRRDAGQTDTAGPDERLQVLAEFLPRLTVREALRASRKAGPRSTAWKCDTCEPLRCRGEPSTTPGRDRFTFPAAALRWRGRSESTRWASHSVVAENRRQLPDGTASPSGRGFAVARTVRKHAVGILAYLDTRMTNGPAIGRTLRARLDDCRRIRGRPSRGATPVSVGY